VGVEAPQELANEKMQAERILGERTVFAKQRRGVGPVVRLQLDASLTNDEAYTLDISNKGVVIKGKTAAGVFCGLMTLEQLCIGNGVAARSVEIPALHIKDQPRTAIRELMVDPVRHFIPFEDLKSYVVEMARYKYNALHLHLVDDPKNIPNSSKRLPIALEWTTCQHALAVIIRKNKCVNWWNSLLNTM